MAKREIEMIPIDDYAERNRAITRLSAEIIKETADFCKETGSDALLIITKPNHLIPNASTGEVIGTSGNVHVHGGAMEAPPLTKIQKRIGLALRNGRWDEAVRGLGYRELEELTTELANVRRMVRAERERMERLPTAAVKEESPSKSGDPGMKS